MKRTPLIVFLFLLLITAFAFLLSRCYRVQFQQHDRFVAQGLRAQKMLNPHHGCRGVILDTCGRILAAPRQIRTVYADPQEIEEPKGVSNALSDILDMGAHVICQRITDSRNPRYVVLKKEVELEEGIRAKRVHRGVGFQNNWVRDYPMGSLASHVVGLTNIDTSGIAGIELEYNSRLSGQADRDIMLADVYRRPISMLQSAVTTPRTRTGQGVILTIDATIQEFARKALLEQYRTYEAESAHATVINPKTGAILAMVSLPEFDRHNIVQDDPRLCNHAVNDQFEPGSILKPIVIAIGLDAGKIRTTEEIFCENGLYHGKGFGSIKEYNYKKYGNLTPKGILINSSNIGMAKIGQRLGKKRLYQALDRFGFGKKTGIRLPGEAKGRLRHYRDWDGYSVTRIPFGHEISVNALQLLRAFCILCNDGRVVRPHLIKTFVDSGGVSEVRDSRFKAADQVGYLIDPKVARWVIRDALTAVVNEGTGHRAKLDRWQVFGKTGTAQVAQSGQYGDDVYIASFISGAPAQDPAIVVLVSIRRPNRSLGMGYTGGRVSSPVAGKIIDQTLNYLESRGWDLVRKPQKESI
jgi:cell division protein FtsI/penicillin-binding protein 2